MELTDSDVDNVYDTLISLTISVEGDPNPNAWRLSEIMTVLDEREVSNEEKIRVLLETYLRILVTGQVTPVYRELLVD